MAQRLVTCQATPGADQQPGKSVGQSVAAALEGRIRLLVFDNAEHVRDAAADLIEGILAHSATVRIVATSREGLGVADEQLWLVPSLDVGAGIDSAAVDLFVERARSVTSRGRPGGQPVPPRPHIRASDGRRAAPDTR